MATLNTKSAKNFKAKTAGGGGGGLLSHEGVYKFDVKKNLSTTSKSGNAMLEVTCVPSPDEAVYERKDGKSFDDNGIVVKTWVLLEGGYKDKDGNEREHIEKLWDVLASAGVPQDEINSYADRDDVTIEEIIDQVGAGPVYATVRSEEYNGRYSSKIGYFRTPTAYADDAAIGSHRRRLPPAAQAQLDGVNIPSTNSMASGGNSATSAARTTADDLL